MDDQLNSAPCGFLTLSQDGIILSINETLLKLLEKTLDQLIKKHVNSILTVPSQLFYQLYFVPIIMRERKIEEMYLSIQSSNGEEVPVILNASIQNKNGVLIIDCVLFPIRKRNDYENELIIAKKEAEAALLAKHEANNELQIALKTLQSKQEELLKLNEMNQKYKLDTKKELELARKIQVRSLTEPIDNKNIQIESFYKASSELSGDIYGFYKIDSHRYGIIILDVMGHGISSALITMSLHSLFQRLISFGVNTETVMKELDHHLHSLFQNNEESRHYCTAIYLLVNTDNQTIEYINAGHPSALLQDTEGNQLYELKSTTVPIGMFEGIAYTTNTFSYTKGDRLLLYTDGITDSLESNHLHSLLKENYCLPISKLKEKLIQTLNNSENFYQKSDDQCFILIDLK